MNFRRQLGSNEEDVSFTIAIELVTNIIAWFMSALQNNTSKYIVMFVATLQNFEV